MELSVQPPVQARSRQTFEAILSATEQLLKSRRFEEITVADVVRAASVSTGSFYARFASKEALLPILYQRYEAGLEDRSSRLVRDLNAAASLADACGAVVRALAATLEDNVNLMTAVTQLVRSNPGAANAVSAPRKQIHADMETAMLRFTGHMPEADARKAIGAAQFMAVCALREAILFPNAPFASITGMGGRALERPVARMMAAFLEGEAS